MIVLYSNTLSYVHGECRYRDKDNTPPYCKGPKTLKEEGLFSRYIFVCNEDYAQTTEDDIEIVPWRQFLDELWAGKII